MLLSFNLTQFYFFLPDLFPLFLHPLSWALTLTAMSTSLYGGNQCLRDVMHAWPISSVYGVLNLFTQRKIATVRLKFRIPVTFLKELGSRLIQNQQFHMSKTLGVIVMEEAGFEQGSPLQTIYEANTLPLMQPAPAILIVICTDKCLIGIRIYNK